MADTHLTITEVARRLKAPSWKIRRLVDSLDATIPRAGLYRLVPVEILPRIIAELQKRSDKQQKVPTR